MYTKVVPIARLQAGAYAVPFSEYEGQSLDSVQIRDASQALLWPVSDVELDGSSWDYLCSLEDYGVQDATMQLQLLENSERSASNLPDSIISLHPNIPASANITSVTSFLEEPPFLSVCPTHLHAPPSPTSAHLNSPPIISTSLHPFLDKTASIDLSLASASPAPDTQTSSVPLNCNAGSPEVRACASLSARAEPATKSKSTTSPGPAPSPLLAATPFPCPKPNCTKSYKQSNGLKYHLTHGKCSAKLPHDRGPLWKALLSKGHSSVTRGAAENMLRVSEGPAASDARLLACAVAGCTRRYKNIAGLRYHYFHSGLHGIDGLSLLASGQHGCLPLLTARGRRSAMEQASAALRALDVDTTR